MVKMVYHSNIFVIVGSKKNQKLKKNENDEQNLIINNKKNEFYYGNLNEKEVIIWDDESKKVIYKYLLKKEVLNLEVTSDKIIIVCQTIIYVFNLQSFQLIDIIKTGINPKGRLFGVCFKERNVLIYPSLEEKQGKLTIKNYDKKNYLYLPHTNSISNIALSHNGHFLITESDKEKLLKIFEVDSGKQLDELDFSKENINDNKFISFSPNDDYFIISGEKGNIPLYFLRKSKEMVGSIIFDEEAKKSNKQTNKFLLIKGIDRANYHLDLNSLEPRIQGNYKNIKLGDKNLFIISSEGEFFKIKFDLSSPKKCEPELKINLNIAI